MFRNKLVWYGLIPLIGILLMLFLPKAYAEYYNVFYSSPTVVETVSVTDCRPRPIADCYRPVRACKPHHRRHYHRHHCPRYRAVSHAEISVYVPPTAPSFCSCEPACVDCTPCSYCPRRASPYYAPTAGVYYLDEYSRWQLDFDRRTADDIGNNLNIDY